MKRSGPRAMGLLFFSVCVGCTSSTPVVVSPFSDLAASCSTEFRAENLTLEDDAGHTFAGLGLSVEPPQSMFRLVQVRRLEGSCAGMVGAFVMSNLYVSETLALGPETVDGPFVLRRNVSIEERYTNTDEPHPELAGEEFVMAFRMAGSTATGKLRSHHVGLWRGSQGDVVRAYSHIGGEFVFLGEILRSSRPLRGVTYFPAPDTQSGRLGLTQVAEDGILRLISIDWSHPDLY